MAAQPTYRLGNDTWTTVVSFPNAEELEKERISFDWTKWASTAKPPPIYDPPQEWGKAPPGPQLKVDWWGYGTKYFNILSGRSPWLSWPCIPCCCRCCLKCAVKRTMAVEEFYLTEPDEALKKMLTTRVSPHCPEFLQGVFWMRDNVAQEVLLTFQDAEWSPQQDFGVKYARYNWSTNLQTFGGTFLAGKGHVHKLSVSPDKKWVNLGLPEHWMYVVQPEDKFHRKDGTPVEFEAGQELMRCSWHEGKVDGVGDMQYQYRMQRVAYLDHHGNLVKTKFYEELKRRAELPNPPHTCCCGYGLDVNADKDVAAYYEPLSNWQGIVYAPSQDSMHHGDDHLKPLLKDGEHK